MSTATNMSTDTTSNNVYDFLKSYTASQSNKSSSELYKANNSKTDYSNDDFKKVLNSKADSKNQEDTQKVYDSNQDETSTEVKNTDEADGIDEVKEKLEELKEDSKSASKDKVNDILEELLSLLAKLGIKQEDLKSNGKINTDTLKSLIEGVNNGKSSNNNLSDIMGKIMELLKNDSVKDKLDTNSLKVIEKLLGNLSNNIVDDNTEATKNIKNSLKNIMSEVSNILDNKQNQPNKVLTLEEMLSKKYSQDNSDEGSTENESSNSAASKDSSKGISKEDKFLNSMVDDNKDDSLNKINLFASRTTAIQNQGVNTVRGLTINKATFTDDLIKDVKFMNTNSLKELTVKVNPGNLGEITIKLVQEDGLMKANLKADSKETSALLSQNLSDIKKQLGEQNLKVSDVNIELYQDDTTFFKEQSFGRQFSEEQGNSNAGSNNNTTNNEASIEEIAASDISNANNLDFFA